MGKVRRTEWIPSIFVFRSVLLSLEDPLTNLYVVGPLPLFLSLSFLDIGTSL